MYFSYQSRMPLACESEIVALRFGNSIFVGNSSMSRNRPTDIFLMPCLIVNDSILLTYCASSMPSMLRRNALHIHSFCFLPMRGVIFGPLLTSFVAIALGWTFTLRYAASFELASSVGNTVSV